MLAGGTSMLCDICGKKEATVHIEEIFSGKSKTTHLCGDCMLKTTQINGLNLESFNLTEVIYNLAEKMAKPQSEELKPHKSDLDSCPECQWSAGEMRKTGMLGCAACYQHFYDILQPVLKTMHNGTQHCGKVAKMSAVTECEMQIASCKKSLEKCVEKELYEEAAVLRDKIKALMQTCQELKEQEKLGEENDAGSSND